MAVDRRGARRLLEAFVAFDRELSIVAVRGRDGDDALPIRWSRTTTATASCGSRCAPAPGVDAATAGSRRAPRARRSWTQLGYVGVLGDRAVPGGGPAARQRDGARACTTAATGPIEGAETSQFENHLRAVSGCRSGRPIPCGMSAMVNLIGAMPDLAAVAGRARRAPARLRQGAAPGPQARVTSRCRADDVTELQPRLDAVLKLTEER